MMYTVQGAIFYTFLLLFSVIFRVLILFYSIVIVCMSVQRLKAFWFKRIIKIKKPFLKSVLLYNFTVDNF